MRYAVTKCLDDRLLLFNNQTSCHIGQLFAIWYSAKLQRIGRTHSRVEDHYATARCRNATAGETVRESLRKIYRFSKMSRATFPLGPNGFCGFPFSSALTPPAFPSVNMNWSCPF